MDRKILSNYIYNILYQLIKIVLPLIIVPYTLSVIGEDALGISDFAGNIAQWFIIFGVLGVNLYGNRTIAKVRDEKDELSKTFFEIFIMQVINVGLALVGYLLYIQFFVHENQLIYALQGLTLVASMFDITWFFYGVEDFKSASLRNILVKIIGVGLIMTLVKEPEMLWLYVVINTCSDIFGQGIMFLQLKKYIHFEKIDWMKGYLKHVKATFVLFIPTIAINVYTLLDQTMLGFLSGNVANVTLYKTAQGFVKMFLYFITSIGAVMLPRITNVFYNKGGKEEVEKYLNTTYKIALYLAIPMTVAMITVSPYFVPWFLPKQPSVALLIQISSPIVLFISMSNVFGTQYLVPTGMNKEYSNSVVFGAICNFCINLCLIPLFAGVGAAIGSICAEFTVTFTQYLYIRNKINVNLKDKNILKYIISALIMGVVVVLIGNLCGASLKTNLIQAIVGATFYFLLLLIMKEDFTTSILHKILKRG